MAPALLTPVPDPEQGGQASLLPAAFPPDVTPPVTSIKSLFTALPAPVIKMVNKTQARSWLCWRALPTPTPGSDLVSLGPWTWSVSPTETAFSARHRRSVNVH